MSRASVLCIVFAVLLAPVGLAAALLPPAAPSSYSFANDVYSVDLAWPDAATSLAEGGRIFTGTVAYAGREADWSQSLLMGDVFVQALGLVDDRFFVLAEEDVSAKGAPMLRLHVSRAPVRAEVPELRGVVTLTFLEDAILHDYEIHLPHVVFADSVYSTTSLAWDAPFDVAGSSKPDGEAVYDDGAALDAYGAWQVHETYGVFARSSDALVGHARIAQGDNVNYLVDGAMRVSPSGSRVETVFTAFLDAGSAGLPSALDAHDAIVFQSADPTPAALHARLGALASAARSVGLFDPASVDVATPSGPIPHVLVGVPDSGINPYHSIYYRPNLTVHPCTYIPDFPCSIPALPLSVGVHDDWTTAYAADAALWDSLEYRKWYWIPQTVFVAVMCEGSTNAASATEGENRCLIDDSSDHGTGTTSSIVTENPNALIAFKEGNSATGVFEDGTLPIDVLSYSWGAAVPLAIPGVVATPRDYGPFYVAASGNEGAFPVVLDSSKASHAVINVGAADGATRSEPGYSGWKTADYVSQYCRPAALTKAVEGYRSYCGTSFAAPTVAGAISKIVLDLRRESGYTGSIVDGMVDPILGVSKWDVRDALNRTASYAPGAKFPAEGGGVPLAPGAPWYQWGWGYVDGTTVDAALSCIRDQVCPEKDLAAQTYMGALWTFRDAYGGWDVIDAMDCAFSGEASACGRMPSLVGRTLA